MKPQVLGFIPARIGSKGIPRKNLVPLAGKPLVAWVCETARRCRFLSDVIVSTDSDEIIAVAQACGVRAPFLRPEALGEDTTLVIDVILHALHWLKDHEGREYEWVCLFQPSSPFGLPSDFDRAIELAVEKNADTVISVYKGDRIHPAYTMYSLEPDGRACWYLGGAEINRMARRQDIQPVFVRSGTVYVFRTALLLDRRTLYGDTITPSICRKNGPWTSTRPSI